jgi:hypothetical protein
MTVDERSRHELYQKLEELLGPTEATTLMEHLPPLGWGDVATKRDIEQLAVATKRDIEQLAVATKRDIEQLAVATKRDIEQLRVVIDSVEHRLAASFRAELLAQTRTMIFAMIGTVVSLGGLTLAALRLA